MSFETKLEKYARLIVQSGLNVQEKQTVVIVHLLKVINL